MAKSQQIPAFRWLYPSQIGERRCKQRRHRTIHMNCTTCSPGELYTGRHTMPSYQLLRETTQTSPRSQQWESMKAVEFRQGGTC